MSSGSDGSRPEAVLLEESSGCVEEFTQEATPRRCPGGKEKFARVEGAKIDASIEGVM